MSSAQVENPPPAMTLPVEKPIVATGAVVPVVDPSPRAPRMFPPQHFVAPKIDVAQECSAPAPTERHPVVNPVTETGVLLLVVVPLPS
jgi:hypothetical protein